MTRAVYQSMFVSLSMLLMAVLFVAQPTRNEELAKFQGSIKAEFAKAAVQVIGDQGFSEPFAFVWSGVRDFYSESADATIALLEPDDSLVAMINSFDPQYQSDILAAQAPLPKHVALDEAILNIVPVSPSENLLDPFFSEEVINLPGSQGQVAGTSIVVGSDVNAEQAAPSVPVVWQDITDSVTGEAYCIAIFYGEVNSYTGPCAREEVGHMVQQN